MCRLLNSPRGRAWISDSTAIPIVVEPLQAKRRNVPSSAVVTLENRVIDSSDEDGCVRSLVNRQRPALGQHFSELLFAEHHSGSGDGSFPHLVSDGVVLIGEADLGPQ